MANIDTSSLVTCTINGTEVDLKDLDIADDSLQQNGLVKSRGKIVVAGIVVPPVNAVVKISGQDKSLANYQIPRTYRVLSSFANVFTGLTDIELGCKLTYLSNRKPPNENPTAKEENGDIPEEVFRSANIPISASYVFQKCLDALDIDSDPIPLESKFAILEFDLSQGYVETMAKLLESESFVGCLDEDEVLRIRTLDTTGGIGPVLTREDLLSIGPIASGALPGEDVVVSYSTKRLKLPNPDEGLERNWEQWSSVGPLVTVLDYELDAEGNQVDYIFEYSEYTYGTATYDDLDRMTRKYELTVDENGPTVTLSLYSYSDDRTSTTVNEYSYTTGPITKVFDGCNFAVEEFPTRASRPSQITTLQTTKVKTVSNTLLGYSQVSTQQFIPYIFTPMGKRVIGRLAPDATGGRIASLLDWAARLVQYGSTVEVRQGREYNIKRRPSQQERNDAALRKAASAVSFARFAWVYGDTESEAVTEFTIPYAPDDIIGWSLVDGYYVTPSNVTNVVLRYGRTQNKLLLGNRQGMNIVAAPKSFPTMPFDVFYVNLFGFTVEYRVNRLSWTGSAEKGIVATCDAALWGAVGVEPGTLISQAWTPLPPGTTALPTLPNYTPGDPPAQNVIRPPASGSPYESYPLVLDSTYSLPIYTEKVYSRGTIKLGGHYKEHRYPYVIKLVPALFEIQNPAIKLLYRVALPKAEFEIQNLAINVASKMRIALPKAEFEIATPIPYIGVGGGGTPWTPAQWSPTGWFDAGTPATFELFGSLANNWNSVAGTGRKVRAPAGSERPTYGSATQNSLNLLTFDGAANFMMGTDPIGAINSNNGASLDDFITASAGTMVVLFRARNIIAGDSGVIYLNPPVVASYYFNFGLYVNAPTGPGSEQALFHHYGEIDEVGSDDIIIKPIGGNNVWVIAVLVHGSGTLTAYLNGGEASSIASGNNLYLSDDPLQLGGRQSSSLYVELDLAEVLFKNAATTESDVRKLEGYIADHWAVQSVLPSDHPYKSSPPML